MADDAAQDDAGHGRIIAGEGKGKSSGPGSLLHGKHGTEIIVICSVIGVGLAFASLRKGSAPAAAPTTSPTGITAGDVAGFDQASVQGMTDNLQTFQQANADALQRITDALTTQGDAENQATAGLSATLGQQSTVLQNLTSAIGGLPQQIVSQLPAPAPMPAPAPAPSQPAPGPAPSPAPGAPSGVSGPQYVTIHSGDTLSGIAAKYREGWITPTSIAHLNGISNINHIIAGRQIRIY